MSEDVADNLTDNQTAEAELSEMDESLSAEEEMADMDGDGVLDFTGPDYRYYAFEMPFVSNLADSKKLLTLELSLLIKRPAFFVDGALEDLMKLAPAMRSQIFSYLITLKPDMLQTRAHRQELARNIRLLLNQYLQADSQDDEDGILEVQILKMVVA
jgi:flagellar basal body-associated protein FliL